MYRVETVERCVSDLLSTPVFWDRPGPREETDILVPVGRPRG